MERDSFVFHREWVEGVKKLPKEFRLDIYEAIIEYALTGTMPTELKPVAELGFTLVKNRIDFDREKHSRISSARAEAGRRSGEARRTNRTNVHFVEQTTNKCEQMRTISDICYLNSKKTLSNDRAKKGDDEVIHKNSEPKRKYGERIAMTEDAHAKLVAQFGEALVAEQIAVADDWLLANGKTQKDYAAFLRNWLKRAHAKARAYPKSNFGNGAQTGRTTPQESAVANPESPEFRDFWQYYPENRRDNRELAWQLWQDAKLDDRPKLARNFAEFVNTGGIAYGASRLLQMLIQPSESVQIRFNEAMLERRDEYNSLIRQIQNTSTIETKAQDDARIAALREARNREFPLLK